MWLDVWLFIQAVRMDYQQRAANTTEQDLEVAEALPPALKRFKFLSNKMSQQPNASQSSGVMETVRGQLNQYLSEVLATSTTVDSLSYWHQKPAYGKLACIAEDLISAPASQAYVERIFSLCGILSSGRRSSMRKSLEMRVFLKLNKRVLKDIQNK
jgi:hypothetical protein